MLWGEALFVGIVIELNKPKKILPPWNLHSSKEEEQIVDVRDKETVMLNARKSKTRRDKECRHRGAIFRLAFCILLRYSGALRAK